MYRIEVKKESLSFSAAHFITSGGKCERLHGHNYEVSVLMEGNLTPDRYVFDFVVLKKLLSAICLPLDHRFLLPEKNPDIYCQQKGKEWEIRYGQRRYIMPEEYVLVLPLDNITAERLAEYICNKLINSLKDYETDNLSSVEVGVGEAPGQTGYYRVSLTEK
jgi:6-pyruvoyltetrahydropterin/6-carboxytetrahydropterin synthase